MCLQCLTLSPLSLVFYAPSSTSWGRSWVVQGLQLVLHPAGLKFASPSCLLSYSWLTNTGATAAASGTVQNMILANRGVVPAENALVYVACCGVSIPLKVLLFPRARRFVLFFRFPPLFFSLTLLPSSSVQRPDGHGWRRHLRGVGVPPAVHAVVPDRQVVGPPDDADVPRVHADVERHQLGRL